MKIKLKGILNNLGKDIVNKIVNKINDVGAVKTGALRESISYKVIKTSNGLTVKFSMIDYGKFVDEGTIHISPREFFNKVIREEIVKVLEKDISKSVEKSMDNIFKN